MTKAELLQLLNETEHYTTQCFDLPDIDLNKSYAAGKWNVRQILHHLSDAEYLLLGRLKKIIAEPTQVIWSFNQDEWNEAFNYVNAPLTHKKELYNLCRELNYQLIDTCYETYILKEFVHNVTGLRTLQMEFEKVALHNQSHNEQLKIALSL